MRRFLAARTCAIAQTFLVLLFATDAIAQATQPASAPLTVSVTYDPAICDSFTGRVYLMTSSRSGGTGGREPRFGPNWFNPQPFYAIDVVDWRPLLPLVFDDAALAYPIPLSAIREKPAEWVFQAVMRRNLDSPDIGSGEGTAYSKPTRHTIEDAAGAAAPHDAPPITVELRIDQVVPPHPLVESERIKLVELRSELLSEFHKRDIMMRAAVILPPTYDANPARMYPAFYWIGGFGSDHTSARFMAPMWDRTGLGDSIVRIVLDPLCYGGHHVFADSDNNGPRGRALVEEFIPHLERTYRLVAAPTARFVGGHSSGGWSCLWLQATYPDSFGGCWSIAPDPIDFRDFQRINLYEAGVNMYRDAAGQPRPIARHGGAVQLYYEPFCKMEVVQGEGGQIRSFEWVFSPRGDDGLPAQLYDRLTGAVNSTIAEQWKRYDIRLVLEENWARLGPKLENGAELRVFVGDADTFYLEGAVKLLKQSQETLKSRAVIEIVPGKDHGSIATAALRQRIDRELIKVFDENHPEHAVPRAYD